MKKQAVILALCVVLINLLMGCTKCQISPDAVSSPSQQAVKSENSNE